MVEVTRVTNEINVHIGWSGDRLSALSPLDYFLEFRPGRLDLTTCIFNILDLFIGVLLDEIVITREHSSPLIRKIRTLELCSFLNAFIVLILLLFQVILVKARWLVHRNRLVPCRNR